MSILTLSPRSLDETLDIDTPLQLWATPPPKENSWFMESEFHHYKMLDDNSSAIRIFKLLAFVSFNVKPAKYLILSAICNESSCAMNIQRRQDSGCSSTKMRFLTMRLHSNT